MNYIYHISSVRDFVRFAHAIQPIYSPDGTLKFRALIKNVSKEDPIGVIYR